MSPKETAPDSIFLNASCIASTGFEFEIEFKMEWHKNDGMTLKWLKLHWNDIRMTEWLWNEVSFRIKGFALVQKYPFISPHSVILHHSRMTKDDEMMLKWVEWHKNDISPLWFSFLVILKWQGMTEWGGMKLFYLGEEKTGFRDTSHSTIIPTFRLSFLKWAWMTAKWPWKILIGCCLP